MITPITKASPRVLNQVKQFLSANAAYASKRFSGFSSDAELLEELKNPSRGWHVFLTDHPEALFTLHVSNTIGILDTFIAPIPTSIAEFSNNLRLEFGRMQIKSLRLRVTEELATELAKNGFERDDLFLRLAGPTNETKLVQMLPLNNPSKQNIDAMAQLMLDCYKSELPSVDVTKRWLSEILDGSQGRFLNEASFYSGTSENIVSVCLVTLTSSSEANVAQLFTHPLYRARGLATGEIAMSMNRLRKLGVQNLTVWVAETNEVARRLFSKLAFKVDDKLVELFAGT